MDNKTWGEIVKDDDEYYAKHKKHKKGEGKCRMQGIKSQ
jgi:hypothetical protein